jgi:GT2 family glycosyltransferase
MKPFAPWTIKHWDLARGAPLLECRQCQGPILLFLWHSRIPLGHLEITPDLLPLPSEELTVLIARATAPAIGTRVLKKGFRPPLPGLAAASQNLPDLAELASLRDPLKMLSMQLSAASAKASRISVIVCTCDRPEQLRRCLAGLKDLEVYPEEIIVVDNGQLTEPTRKVASAFPGIRYMQVAKRGLSAARNAGIHASSHEILAFTDDDAVVHPQWLIRIAAAFENEQTLAVTGLVLPAELKTEAQVKFQKLMGTAHWDYRAVSYGRDFFRRWKSRGTPVWNIGAGANMAFRKKVFELVGYFDERLGAGASGCSEDSEMWYKVLAEGYECRYEPAAVVYHYHRQEMEELKKQLFAYMRGHVVALLVQFEKYRHWGNLVRLGIILPWTYLKALLAWLRDGFSPRQQMLLPQVAGCLAGCLYYLRHRRRF